MKPTELLIPEQRQPSKAYLVNESKPWKNELWDSQFHTPKWAKIGIMVHKEEKNLRRGKGK